MEEKKEKELSVTVVTANFDNLGPIFAMKNIADIDGERVTDVFVCIDGICWDDIEHDPDEPDECIVCLEKELFLKIFSDWIQKKSDYHERYDYFCGEGYVILEVAVELTEPKETMRSFLCDDFEIDMEHG